MILPIVAYGDIVLKTVGKPIQQNSEELSQLIENMWETMYNAKGVGLAAPQIGQSIKLFLVDTEQLELENEQGLKRAFINAEIINFSTAETIHEEGCLSIPDINAEVQRPETITIRYLDEDFNEHTEEFTGFAARVIQHEYDHIQGILFTDKINPLKKRLLKKKLDKIAKAKINPSYKMAFSKV